MGIFNKIRGGVGSDHYSGRNDYPYQGNGAPAYTSDALSSKKVSDTEDTRKSPSNKSKTY